MPKKAYVIDSISFMFTKAQNCKSFSFNNLSAFRESLKDHYPDRDVDTKESVHSVTDAMPLRR